MARRLVVAGLLGAAALGLLGCSSGGGEATRRPALRTSPLRGGTLRVGVDHPFGTDPRSGSAPYALDPQFEYLGKYWELYRCCLLRTLLSYNGQSTAQGGATLRPDLAAGLPRVSRDGLTWVFHLKHGLHYAPPFQGREIVAGDIVRALEREFRLGVSASYSFYYTVIEGAKAFAAHRADSISGLEVPDPHTLVVHLTEPTGDLGYRFSLAATAPIPAGADRGHDGGYGRYLVSSGPYMIAGSEKMNFALPPRQQRRPRAGTTTTRSEEGGSSSSGESRCCSCGTRRGIRALTSCGRPIPTGSSSRCAAPPTASYAEMHGRSTKELSTSFSTTAHPPDSSPATGGRLDCASACT
jgi:ABC-type oligopeptide transport system substrate-binding subunit